MNDSDLMLDFEEQYKMFDKLVIGVHYWQLIRMALFMEVLNLRVKVENRHPDFADSYSGIKMIKGGVSLLYHSFFKNSYKQAKGKTVICAARRRISQAEQLAQEFRNTCFMVDRPNKFMHFPFSSECGMAYSDSLDFRRSVAIKILQLVPTKLERAVQFELDSWYDKFNEFMKVEVLKKH